jgi:transposase
MKDYNAVIAAVIYNQSNGLTEGCVNRLKNIKDKCMEGLDLNY